MPLIAGQVTRLFPKVFICVIIKEQRAINFESASISMWASNNQTFIEAMCTIAIKFSPGFDGVLSNILNLK